MINEEQATLRTTFQNLTAHLGGLPTTLNTWWQREWHAVHQLRREDLSLTNAGQWPGLLKLFMIIMSQLALLWLGYHYVVATRYDNWQQARQHGQQLTEQWQSLPQHQATDPQAAAVSSVAPANHALHTTQHEESLGITAAQIPLWTQHLETHFQQFKVNLIAFSLAETRPYADWQAQPFQLQLTGHYGDLAHSLGQLSALTPLLTWHDFTLQKAPSDPEPSTASSQPALIMTINGRLLLRAQDDRAQDDRTQGNNGPNHDRPTPNDAVQRQPVQKPFEWPTSTPKAASTYTQFLGDMTYSPMVPFAATQNASAQRTHQAPPVETPPEHSSPLEHSHTAPTLSLAGIIQYQGQVHALIQTPKHAWHWVQPGDPVEGGYISHITFNGLIWTESLKDETTQHYYGMEMAETVTTSRASSAP